MPLAERDLLTELRALGFARHGAIRPLAGGGCRAELDCNLEGFVVYAHVVGETVKKFGVTRNLLARVRQNAATINQVIALGEGRARSDARWHHRPFDAFKVQAPAPIKAGHHIDIWARTSTEAGCRRLERELNAAFETRTHGWTIRLG